MSQAAYTLTVNFERALVTQHNKRAKLVLDMSIHTLDVTMRPLDVTMHALDMAFPVFSND